MSRGYCNFSTKAGECVSEGPQPIGPQEEAEQGEPQAEQCPEGAVFNAEIDACSFPLGPADEADQQGEPQAEQCPEGTVFSTKAGECVSEGPQPIGPQEDEGEQGCPPGTSFVKEGCVPDSQPIGPQEDQEEPQGDEGGGDGGSIREDLLGGLDKKAPVTISGNHVFVTWWTNQTGDNNEVMFRASATNGQTFSDKINLSNSTDADSQDAKIEATEGGDVIITWWERNQTSDVPVARISNDNGTTFGPILILGSNGTLGE